MSEVHAPHEVADLLQRVMAEGQEAAVCDEQADVAAFVWIGESGLAMLAEELERQREQGNSSLNNAAYVLRDGSLVVVGQGSRGAFAFNVPQRGWGWCRRLA
jgi:hypothetical protein